MAVGQRRFPESQPKIGTFSETNVCDVSVFLRGLGGCHVHNAKKCLLIHSYICRFL